MEKKSLAKKVLLGMGILIITGVIVIFSASAIGKDAGYKVIEKNNGEIDSNTYKTVIEDTTINYRTLGTIISFLGIGGFLLSGYVLYKET